MLFEDVSEGQFSNSAFLVTDIGHEDHGEEEYETR
jgi:hypothetical protein